MSSPSRASSRRSVCDCEHSSHFRDDYEVPAKHPYGESRPEVREVKTPWSTFYLCAECRSDGHMSDSSSWVF